MSNNKYVKIPIKGMHCRSCELLIEESLTEIPHVKSVDVDYKEGEAIVYHDGNTPDSKVLNKAIIDAGYEIGRDGKLPFFSTDKKEYLNLALISLLWVVVMIFTYYAYQTVGVVYTSLIMMLAPLLIVLGSRFVLNEKKIEKRSIIALGVVLACVIAAQFVK